MINFSFEKISNMKVAEKSKLFFTQWNGDRLLIQLQNTNDE